MIVLAIVDDLVFQAKIQAAAVPLGVEVRIAKNFTQAQEAWADPAVVIVDLSLAVPIIGYGSHVQTELLAQARAAGCTTVLPRSAFAQQLPSLLAP